MNKENDAILELDEENLPETIPTFDELSDLDLINDCCGLDEDGNSKATIAMSLVEFNGDVQNVEQLGNQDFYDEISSRVIANAEISIFPRREVVEVDLKFKTALAPELRFAYNLLDNFGKLTTAKGNMKVTMLGMVIVPEKYDGKYVVSLENPLYWSLEPDVVGTQNNNKIRIIFSIDNLFSVDNSDEITNEEIEKMKAEASRTQLVEYKEK